MEQETLHEHSKMYVLSYSGKKKSARGKRDKD